MPYTCKLTVDGKTFIATHARAFEAGEEVVKQFAEWTDCSLSQARDLLADASESEAEGFEDVLELDGQRVEWADHI